MIAYRIDDTCTKKSSTVCPEICVYMESNYEIILDWRMIKHTATYSMNMHVYIINCLIIIMLEGLIWWVWSNPVYLLHEVDFDLG